MLRRALKIVAFPLAVLAVFGLLYAIWLALDLPPEATIIAIGKSYLDRYGLWIVLVCGYLEALVVIGWYFPGTLVLIFAMIAASPEPVRYVETAAIGAFGLYCGQVTNFFAGKDGWYRLLLAFGLREPLEKAKAAADQVWPERDLHHLLAGQSCLVHFDRRRHPAISRAALRRAGLHRTGAVVRVLGDDDFSAWAGRAFARGLPHDPAADPDLDRGAADLSLEIREAGTRRNHAARRTSSASARYDSASARCTRPIFSAPSRSASVRATRSTR